MVKRKGENLTKCPGCGGNLLFNPSSQDLACERCNSHVAIEKNGDIVSHDYVGGKNGENNEEWSAKGRTFRCKSCGGQVDLSGLEISKICPYCGSTYVSEIETLPGLKPDAVIPFAFDKNEAISRFKFAVKKKAFLPSNFKKSLPASKIYGLYIPCFSFDANVYATYRGVLEEDYTTRDKDGNSITQVRRIPISGNYEAYLKNVDVESSQKMTQAELSSILPYNHGESQCFDDGFLRGYFVEHYEDSLDECHEKAQDIMKSEVRSMILSRYNYDRVCYLDIDAKYTDEKYLYKLMPVYKFEYTYKKKKYLTCMNGQTGKVQNNLPKSGWKIFGVVFGVLAFIALFILLFVLID